DARNVIDHDLTGDQERGRQHRQRLVLVPGRSDGAGDGVSAIDDEAIHRPPQRSPTPSRRCMTRVESAWPETSTTRKPGGPGNALPARDTFYIWMHVDGVVSMVSRPDWIA